MANSPPSAKLSRKRAPLLYFLGFVSAVFIGILIWVYVVTKHANPIFLDAQGKPTNAEPQQHTSSR